MEIMFHSDFLKNKYFDNQNNNNIFNSLSLLFSELKNKEKNQTFQSKINDVILECTMIDLIQQLVEVCEPHIKSFKLRLEME